ncbi:helix-turn-helix transcriptional regulator [Streptomonospora salina]|uniref:Putative DNA-binding transcriptional regulator YafY n=1 Tax=Streptomonospora salina TaxID=104205 RepID=A0A841ECD9_9ACTN|nr:YafY family protein [Streptomonospora salina]MBB6000762.1 putative DNA-binding transcriptional regulator YafY [Streptomonospora salina]
MADTTARALQLLDLLQSAHLRTVAELAERLGVDERTIRRDVARLCDLGVPVETVRGRYGGYRLASGQRVLPLMFSREEVIVLYLGLARSQSASHEPQVAAQTALAKVKRAMPIADAERIDTLLGVMTPTSQHGGAAPEPSVMLTLAEAVDHRQVLDLRYLSGRGAPSRRTIHPYALVAHADRWYLVAFDADKQAERTFRVDRIRTARSLPGTFSPPQRSDAEPRLRERFADADYRWQVVLRIRESEEHIRAHLPLSVARLERSDGAEAPEHEGTAPWHRAEIHAESLDWLPAVIAALDCEVMIDRPDELRDRVRATATRLLHTSGRTR